MAEAGRGSASIDAAGRAGSTVGAWTGSVPIRWRMSVVTGASAVARLRAL